jgi:hypothetical protein
VQVSAAVGQLVTGYVKGSQPLPPATGDTRGGTRPLT